MNSNILLIIFLTFALILYSELHISYADEMIVPEWVFTIHDYWLNSEITSTEFQNAIKYLQNREILALSFNSDYDPITNFLISSSQDELTDSFTNCSSNWYITGYFTPVEDDYSGDLQEIQFENTTKYVKIDFINSVKTEGWGKTTDGSYLGWYDDTFHLNPIALDSHGAPLVSKFVAVDPQIIKQKTHLTIPDLPMPWNNIIFESSDIGPSIIGKHIDVYTGEGRESELETFRITGENNDVCIELTD